MRGQHLKTSPLFSCLFSWFLFLLLIKKWCPNSWGLSPLSFGLNLELSPLFHWAGAATGASSVPVVGGRDTSRIYIPFSPRSYTDYFGSFFSPVLSPWVSSSLKWCLACGSSVALRVIVWNNRPSPVTCGIQDKSTNAGPSVVYLSNRKAWIKLSNC